jgi:putative flavoprotein involved in K+ transport
MVHQVETIIIGGGQAGLATSYGLQQRHHEHIVLEQAAQAANAWRNDRWDSFTFVTPNWTIKMPGAEYDGSDPDGFLGRAEIIRYFEDYVARFNLPVQYNTRVTAIEPQADDKGYLVTTDRETYAALQVVMATGMFQRPKLPAWSGELPAPIVQLHSGAYRNPAALPPGSVLVVGSAQSGCQIAEELYQSGRTVYLSVSGAGRAPRRYRGKDIFEWLDLNGFLNRTVDKLPSPKAKFGPNPQVSGRDGGHALNLHQFARDGVILLGHVQAASDGSIGLAADLKESLAKVDKFEVELVKMIDSYIEKNGVDAPPEILPQLRDGYAVEEPRELNLKAANITSIIWAAGYRFEFNQVRAPIFDEDGYPIQQRGVTSQPGLYFVGLPWLDTQKSGLLLGVGSHAEYIAEQVAGNGRH